MASTTIKWLPVKVMASTTIKWLPVKVMASIKGLAQIKRDT